MKGINEVYMCISAFVYMEQPALHQYTNAPIHQYTNTRITNHEYTIPP